MGPTAMWNINVVVVALLAVIMLLLLLILGVVLLSPAHNLFRKKVKKHASHIYETIDNEEDEQHNCVTQVLKIQVSSERGYIQQEMLLKVQVEVIPLHSEGEGVASTSNFGPQSSPKPMLMHLQDVPQDRIKIRIKDHGNANFGFSQIDPEGRKPSPPPKTPPVKMLVTPSMIKDPSLLSLQSRTSESEHVALVHSRSMEETSGYLQPSSLRKLKNKGTGNKENPSETQY